MIYLDTSAIVKLYVKEVLSREISNWIKKNNEAIPLTGVHDLEFNNALRLKQFRGEIIEEEFRRVISKFNSHQRLGVFYRPQLNWKEILKFAVQLSNNHTADIGSRSLDILHVASALAINSEKFLTFHESQSNLASLAKIELIDISV